LGINIPDEGEKIELSNGNLRAVVTKNNNLISIVADLPELKVGESYEVVGLGNLQQAKGGYILNSELSENITEITIKQGDVTILQGSF